MRRLLGESPHPKPSLHCSPTLKPKSQPSPPNPSIPPNCDQAWLLSGSPELTRELRMRAGSKLMLEQAPD